MATITKLQRAILADFDREFRQHDRLRRSRRLARQIGVSTGQAARVIDAIDSFRPARIYRLVGRSVPR